jgi:hypothetical protein
VPKSIGFLWSVLPLAAQTAIAQPCSPRWAEIRPQAPIGDPVARRFAAGFWDNQGLLMFGGLLGAEPLGDTWRFDGAAHDGGQEGHQRLVAGRGGHLRLEQANDRVVQQAARPHTLARPIGCEQAAGELADPFVDKGQRPSQGFLIAPGTVRHELLWVGGHPRPLLSFGAIPAHRTTIVPTEALEPENSTRGAHRRHWITPSGEEGSGARR